MSLSKSGFLRVSVKVGRRGASGRGWEVGWFALCGGTVDTLFTAGSLVSREGMFGHHLDRISMRT